MEPPRLFQEIASLPPEAQKQIQDFVAFLKARYPTMPGAKARRTRLVDEPFIGMWRDRKDMVDSTTWVRQIRRGEWERTK